MRIANVTCTCRHAVRSYVCRPGILGTLVLLQAPLGVAFELIAIDSGGVKVIYVGLAGGLSELQRQDPKLPESSLNTTAMLPLTTLTNNYLHTSSCLQGLGFFHLFQYYISFKLYRSKAHVTQRPLGLV